MVGCLVALAAILCVSTLCTRYIGAAALRFGLPGFVGPLCCAAGYGVLAVVSYFKLGIMAYRRVSVILGIAAPGFGLLFVGAELYHSGVLFVMALVAYAAVYVWMNFLLACCLVRLPSFRLAAAAVIGGPILHQFALFICHRVQDNTLLLSASAVVSVLVIAGLAVMGAPLFRSLASRESVALLELTNPLASLKPPYRLYTCVLLVSCIYYFANAFGVPSLGLRRTFVVVLMLGLLYLLLIRGEHQEDRLFSLVVLLIMAGILMEAVLLERDVFMAHTCIFVGFKCFTILVWLVVYGLGVRNITFMVPFFGAVEGLDSLGRCVGAQLGQEVAILGGASPLGMQTAILCLALFFFGCVWVGFRKFSFTEAIRGIETVEAVEVVASDEAPAVAAVPGTDQRLRMRCDELAQQASLTPREAEIFELLARGRNAQYIMDTLTITRNTAKAHIRHIYTKLGVHSQQELLSLVEDSAE